MSTTIIYFILVLATSSTDTNEGSQPPWLILIGSLASLIFGATGINAWMKAAEDKRRRIREDDRLDDAAVDSRVRALLEDQEKTFILPLKQDIRALKDELAEQSTRITQLETRYRIAIDYIKHLFYFFDRELPEWRHEIPKPPKEIEDELK